MSDILTIKCCAVIPSATPTRTNTATPTITPSPTITRSVTASPTTTPSHTVTQTITPSNTATPTVTPSNTATPTITPSNTVTRTITPSITASPTITPSITPSNSLTPSITPSNSLTPTITPSNTVTPTITPSITPSPSVTPSITPSPSVTPSITPSTSITPSITPSRSVTPTITPSNSLTPTITPSNSLTPTRTPTKTPTPTPPPQWQLDAYFTLSEQFSASSRPRIHISSDGARVAISTDSNDRIIRGNNNIYEYSGSDISQWSDITGSSDGLSLIACRSNGLLSRSYNRGASWSNFGLSKNWRGIVSNSDTSKIYGIVNNEFIYYSHNSGSSFTVTNNDIPRLWKTLDIIETAGFTTIYAAATSDFIYKGIQQLDGSFVWSTLTGAGSRDWTTVAVAKSAGTIVASSSEGVYKSTNDGTSWANILVGDILCVDISNDGSKIIANTYDLIYTSLNGGTTWSSENLVSTELAVAVNANGTKFIGVGAGNTIYIYNKPIS